MIAIVSSMALLRSAVCCGEPLRFRRGCNLSAMHCGSRTVMLGLVMTLIGTDVAFGQDGTDVPAQQNEHRAADTVKFLAGAAAAFAGHEAGHLFFDSLFDAHPFVKGVHLGPIPFFAV